MIIDQHLLDELAAQAKTSPRLRMNLNFYLSLDEKVNTKSGRLSTLKEECE